MTNCVYFVGLLLQIIDYNARNE